MERGKSHLDSTNHLRPSSPELFLMTLFSRASRTSRLLAISFSLLVLSALGTSRAWAEPPLLAAGVIPAADTELPTTGQRYELKLYHLHTGESLDVIYRIGDTYIPSALEQLNHFLRDHRTQDISEYDPSEFDLLHNLLTRLKRPNATIDIVCGYRTPQSNQFLRTLGGTTDPSETGVAEHSQHMLAKAIDIRVPGVSTRRLGRTPTRSPSAVSTCSCDSKCWVRLATTIFALPSAAWTSVSR